MSITLTKPIKEERYVFEVEWYDQQAEILRFYRLFFFPTDSSVEMFDKKMNRMFIKRIELPTLRLSDLFVGAKVTVFARVLTVKEYGDIATEAKQSGERQSTFAMIKPDQY
jgi:nucleoside-diphosphate kinase